MPMHDWTKVEAGIYHAFHHGWISEIARTLNRGLLPTDHYALPEQVAAGLEPDVLTLQIPADDGRVPADIGRSNGGTTLLQTPPQTRFTAQSDADLNRRKKSAIVVRHVSGDRVVALIEIVSPGNKSHRRAFQDFVNKACEFLEHRIHLLLIDPFPPGPRDPQGIHAAIWEQVQDAQFELPADQSLTFVAYECDHITRAYIETLAVGQLLPDMPLYLEPHGYVMVPLEATYQAAFTEMPRRWQTVLEP